LCQYSYALLIQSLKGAARQKGDASLLLGGGHGRYFQKAESDLTGKLLAKAWRGRRLADT
jgi:hypothetical protein